MNVADIQRALIRHGFDPRGVDGLMGENTIKAIKAFQASRGLWSDGIVGTQTRNALAQPVRAPVAPVQQVAATPVAETAEIRPVAALPAKYGWLLKDAATIPLLREAVRLHGTKEKVGAGSNPTILAWAKETGLAGTYRDDAIAWCGLFAAVIAKRAGYQVVNSPLWARNWAQFGVAAPVPMLGDILAFTRGTGGHVGVYVGEDASAFFVLGGNQSDQVNITRIEKKRLIAARQPDWGGKAPANRRVVKMAASGPVSKNEA